MKRRGYIGAWQQLRWAGQLLGPKEKTAYERGKENIYVPGAVSNTYQWKDLETAMGTYSGVRWTSAENDTPLGLVFISSPLKLENGLSFVYILSLSYLASNHQLRVVLSFARLGGATNNTGQVQTKDLSAGYWSDYHAKWYRYINGDYAIYTEEASRASWRVLSIFLSEKIYENVTVNPLPDMYQNGITIHPDFASFAKSKNTDTLISSIYEEIYTRYGKYTSACFGSGQLFPNRRGNMINNPYIVIAYQKTASDPNLVTDNLIVFNP